MILNHVMRVRFSLGVLGARGPERDERGNWRLHCLTAQQCVRSVMQAQQVVSLLVRVGFPSHTPSALNLSGWERAKLMLGAIILL